MNIRNRRLFSLFLIVSFVALSGCTIPSANAEMPTVDADAVQKTVAAIQTQSVNAAYQQLTQSALLTPAATNTTIPTNTVEPSATPTNTEVPPTSTSTNTPIVNTSTPIPTLTKAVVIVVPSSTPTQGAYQCSVTSVNPTWNLKVDKGVDFDLKVTFKNIGTKMWDDGDVDFKYISGAKFQKRVDVADLTDDVDPGDKITMAVDMLANTDKGYQSATWALTRSGTEFCWVTIRINVQ